MFYHIPLLHFVALILVLLLLVGLVPHWPHSAAWGWYPVSGVFLVVIVFMLLLLL